MTAPTPGPRTLADQIHACADQLTTATLLDRPAIVAATLRDLAEQVRETETRAEQAWQERDRLRDQLVDRMDAHDTIAAATQFRTERDELRQVLTVVRMIAEEAVTDDAGLLRQAILEQLPPRVGAERPQDGPHSHAQRPAGAETDTEPRQDGCEPQEAAQDATGYRAIRRQQNPTGGER